MSRTPLARTTPDLRNQGYPAIRDRVVARIDAERFRDALSILMGLRDLFSADPDYLGDLALCHWGLDEAQIAIDLMQIALRASPDRAAFHGRLGSMYLSLGQVDDARLAFERGLRQTPKSAQLIAALDRASPIGRNDRRTEILRRITRSSRLTPEEKATAANTLGRIEERACNFQAAFRHFTRANALLPGGYDPGAIDRHVAAQVARFVPPPDLGARTVGLRVIFVVGMPRSGTTLVDSILERHPDTASIGESQALPRALAACRAARLAADARSAWDWQDGLSAADRARFRAIYFDHALQRFPGDPPEVIIDKLPLNALEVGFATHILPDARIIHLSRHPLDQGLSNFVTNFQRANAFSRRLDHIAHLTGCVAASAQDYAQKLGPAFRLQSYRALVEEPECQIRQMLDHAGLRWSADCLSPEQGTRIVRTASVTQVRRGINRDGLGKWRRFAPELAPLIDALGGPYAIATWEENDRG
ncbi:sulfotransferase [Ponticoccus sp. SC2-23]|uniref:sulfotransferase n=1 Tax=Alexandriicola marinus TaxID=2081710 RepID=UPI0013DEB802|nr:sulfotransferase [Alexandriicola marinus]MBM1220824.1 sulfotransferase [Ponticoccus sp. SC6-9]MBM1225394.1 sulfotransferase [Ponticoccus sp. SC6-15]MBM1227577.1 sulfotransferase [Ponticoccus sp. SC6-38]MBM1234785.1 sulfotransferase [Ponticoccus sp. SC6-45]MBM1238079.1 sulfotransferase [Ponticoccus sp. SC6-49]MBM1244288.1 sulfotransferase [Ponticoccus sp. SC2-64]MBM1248309.1 sulfotransferase [Ponticoccus sp. SC6-42]MBM1252479.1 sulfotransferase [Ponticoccus sp. SC6-33]MBM1256088.1 sulfot